MLGLRGWHLIPDAQRPAGVLVVKRNRPASIAAVKGGEAAIGMKFVVTCRRGNRAGVVSICSSGRAPEAWAFCCCISRI